MLVVFYIHNNNLRICFINHLFESESNIDGSNISLIVCMNFLSDNNDAMILD